MVDSVASGFGGIYSTMLVKPESKNSKKSTIDTSIKDNVSVADSAQSMEQFLIDNGMQRANENDRESLVS